ncbi:hypothetical protein LTR05_007385 [Lithohypha guttulata]|uniref:C2H2-type domain-containing protein n=1 Tax=Lithohypha guttulata TaxID=1690604 RepID=A0AAN7YDP9_9EURO|nr:hypothetical protein LTR05_007385 [Lithohypha guttulata]
MAQARNGSLGPPHLSSFVASDDQLAPTFDISFEPSREERLGGDNGLLAGLYNALIEALTLCLRQHVPRPVPTSNILGSRVLHSGRVIKAENRSSREAVHEELNNHVAQLVLWGDAISSGMASFLATSAPDLYRNVTELLRDCGKGIQKLGRRLAIDTDSASNEFSILESWLEKVDNVPEADAASSSDSESDGESLRSSPSDADSGDDVEVLGENAALLMDMLPSIADVSNVKESSSNSEVLSRIAFEVSAPAQPWISKIADNYKKAPDKLVKRLGEANWRRFCRLRMREDEGLAQQLEKAKSVFCPSWHDSGIGASLQPTKAAHSAASHSSFASSVAVDTHHYNRVPLEPPEVALGKPFLCPDHVDVFHENLNPAQRSILVAAAAQVKTETIQHWVCPLCKKTDFNTQRKYTSHVCAHMENIALPTLPRDVYGADDESHEEESSSTEDMEGELMRCICGVTTYPGVDERGNFLIQCDDCHVWQHGACVLPDQTHIPDHYYCERCRPGEHEVGQVLNLPSNRKATLNEDRLIIEDPDSLFGSGDDESLFGDRVAEKLMKDNDFDPYWTETNQTEDNVRGDNNSTNDNVTSNRKKHKCPYCATEFARHHNLKSHLLIHSQEKPYACSTCDSRFRRLHDLKRHTELHAYERRRATTQD